MKKQTKIKSSSLPTRSPVATSLLFWLLLEHTHAPEWAYGVFWTLTAILVAAFIVSFFTEVERDVPGFGDRS
ncbi:hypothetical protein GTP38_11295 [Duganella sp. FT94W]|uniref:Uncharacterized protein n=1 Tax=Duganella lactea TaxID=2692173 RepID=A0ABW9VBA8_9BURK|nr:hypothetical protein [Duganella lactea]MYM34922.1 hypothetical protein [Duganella lactea]